MSESKKNVASGVKTHGRLLTKIVIVSPDAKVSKLAKIASCAKSGKSSIPAQKNANLSHHHLFAIL